LVGVAALEVFGRRRGEEHLVLGQVLMRGELQKEREKRRVKEQERGSKRMAADPIGSNCSGWR